MKRVTRSARTDLLLLAAVAVLAAAPLVIGAVRGRAQPFTGSDSQAKARIIADHPEYRPWFHSLYTPPSAEVESGLFALQAALGAGFFGYYLGVVRTRRHPAAGAAGGAGGAGAGGAAGGDPDAAPGG